jgi:hypothetical protein
MKNNKLKPALFIVDLELIPFQIAVSVEQSDQTLTKFLHGYGYSTEDMAGIMNLPETVNARCVMLHKNHTVIRIKSMNTKHELAGSIAHEALHATSMIMECIGVKFCPLTSEEIYAYTVQKIVKEIHKQLKL